jgi:hypothetical protein
MAQMLMEMATGYNSGVPPGLATHCFTDSLIHKPLVNFQ